MHWIQTIRAHLKISQEELAGYLGLSLHTLQSVEQGRRQLPINSLRPAMIIFQAIITSQAGKSQRGFVATDHYTKRRKLLHHQYHRKLNRCELKLETMQQTYDSAIANLGIYQQIAQTLTDEDDPVHRKWTERKIEETARLVKENDTGAQDPIHLQISVLRGITRQLEEPQPYDSTGNPTPFQQTANHAVPPK
jgi:transcriptional regulator with XRE-family HTH domain